MAPIIIIGAGIAGYSLIRNIRALNKHIPILVITSDNGDYYFKPILTNVLGEKKDVGKLIMSSGVEMAKKYNFELQTNCLVEHIDTSQNRVHSRKGNFCYQQLVYACGASPRKLNFQNENIFSINNLNDYMAFYHAVKNKKHVTILGSGFVGCEFANDLALGGFQVAVVSTESYALEAVISNEISRELQKKLSLLGVRWYMNTKIGAIKSEEEGVIVNLENGGSFSSDVILTAIGLTPNIELAKKSGIKVNKGVIVDPYLRTSHPKIFSIGDCAEINGRILPFINAINLESQALAMTLLGTPSRVSFPDLLIKLKTPSYPISFYKSLGCGEAYMIIDAV